MEVTMKNSMKAFKRFTCLLGIVFILLGLLPVPMLSNVGQVFADEGEDPVEPGGSGDPPGEPECTGCENLPQEGDPAVSGSFKVDAAIPGSENAAMTGDLTVGGYTFENVPGVCGEVEDTIQIGSLTSFSVCSVTDTACINAMRTEQGKSAFTDDEAFFYGSSFDDIFEASVKSENYNNAIDAFRWITGNNTNPFDFPQGDERISTWIGLPQNQRDIQSLAWWLGPDCYYEHCTPKACPADPGCGYPGVTMDDGCGKQLTCPATDPCPVNCEWSDWSACSASCGGGTQTRTILIEANYGGLECEGSASRACNTQACPSSTTVVPLLIPVTAAGGPEEPLELEEALIIPVTGLDLTVDFGGIQTLFTHLSFLMFGIAIVLEGLEGIDRRQLKK